MMKRDLFAELMQGVNEMGEHCEEKITLRQFEVEALPTPHFPGSVCSENPGRFERPNTV